MDDRWALLAAAALALSLAHAAAPLSLDASPGQLTLEPGDLANITVNVTAGSEPERALVVYASEEPFARIGELGPGRSRVLAYPFSARAPGSYIVGISVRRLHRELARRDVVVEVAGEVLAAPSLPPAAEAVPAPSLAPSPSARPPTKAVPARSPVPPGLVAGIAVALTIALVLLPRRRRPASAPPPQSYQYYTQSYQQPYGGWPQGPA